MTSQPIDIDISTEDRGAIADALSQFLADSYSLYLKTQNYHWNVTGPQFGALHAMFEEQYQDLALAVDEIAERIRALGHLAPASFSAFAARSGVPEPDSGKVPAMEMVRALAQDNETLSRTASHVIEVAEAGSDDPTADMATARRTVHEKAAWMLRSYLE